MLPQSFSSLDRKRRFEGIAESTYELIVIGGGITGAGIALDAVTRGMSVLLVEMQDFAAGTSSRSTKLVHGGLRYLKQFEVGMVAEVGKERAVVYENGPHVTTPEWMLLPIHQGGTFGKFSTSVGLMVYDFLAGVKRGERRSMLSVSETLKREPLLKQEGLKGGGYYVEYRTDDARLTLEVMKEAAARGAVLFNYAKAESLNYDTNGRITGITVRDMLDGEVRTVTGTKIVNAAGPWVDQVREMDKSKKGKMLQLTKGVHLVIDQSKFPLRQAVYFDTPDGRMVFAIPRDGKTYVGTTDTVYKANPVRPLITVEDRDYILKAIHYMFPDVKLSAADVESGWAGVRPLILEEGKSPSEISRKDEIWESPSGLITIAGGKLTGYRKMADTVVDLVAKRIQEQGGQTFGPGITKNLPISGGHIGGSRQFPEFVRKQADIGAAQGIDRKLAEQWAQMYGSNVTELFRLASAGSDQAEASALPVSVLVPLMYAIQYELASKPTDFFIRRTGSLLFNIQWTRKWKEPVMDYMASVLAWSEQQRTEYARELDEELASATQPIAQEQSEAVSLSQDSTQEKLSS
ncbi:MULTISPECIES: glycerol-3-phosphate dehydrogenase/oxidase [Paenibacillus]|jgi:glycerol-3-phosphate dehydrogenase|uniref:glycerol-3-phosphate dehydrogenase/oxidase n=1 Tax=Paenibacillus TaxID=44249 RepID=UPI0003E2458D|nr:MULTISPECIES: glycerol-3-phosphate dehydrogenase/oxidase [Paenibacillus]ANA83260.1 glycerol-3-phosphate dehydrogenase [Paenibacillus glucanolyticus]AWP26808.1 glycerol-3-phosphate dehydrogenase [Paenibacillus sp. Cedars]ETT34417.1 FAD dependent oxidoreductase [Paenibacillus sp. FSL R5-808]